MIARSKAKINEGSKGSRWVYVHRARRNGPTRNGGEVCHCLCGSPVRRTVKRYFKSLMTEGPRKKALGLNVESMKANNGTEYIGLMP